MKASVSVLGKGKGFYNGKRGFVFSVCLPFLADCIFVSRSEKGNSSCPSLLLYLSGICFFPVRLRFCMYSLCLSEKAIYSPTRTISFLSAFYDLKEMHICVCRFMRPVEWERYNAVISRLSIRTLLHHCCCWLLRGCVNCMNR
jgi:hypothetical protein